MGLVVQKFGGTSVEGPGAAAGGRAAARGRARRGERRRRRPLRDGRGDRRPDRRSPTRSRRRRIRASSTCCSRSGSGSRARSPRWRSTTSATPRSRSPARRRESSPTPTTRAPRCSRSAPRRIHDALAQGAIVLVAGFQGVSTAHEVTTLGRGGSDATAVALAAALEADVCEIYTDVEGVFTADPRLVPNARKLDAALLRGDAGAGRVRRQGADAALGRVRPQPRSPHPRPLLVLGGRGNLGRQSGGVDGAADHLGDRARHLGGGGDDPRRARPARRSPRASSARSPTWASTWT